MAYGHGKVILFGEHAVVHGYPALAKAVPNGAEVTAGPGSAGVAGTHGRAYRRATQRRDYHAAGGVTSCVAMTMMTARWIG